MGRLLTKITAIIVSVALMLGMVQTVGWFAIGDVTDVLAATTAITSMDYYSSKDGPTITKSGVGEVSYGFVMPKFNGKEVTNFLFQVWKATCRYILSRNRAQTENGKRLKT